MELKFFRFGRKEKKNIIKNKCWRMFKSCVMQRLILGLLPEELPMKLNIISTINVLFAELMRQFPPIDAFM